MGKDTTAEARKRRAPRGDDRPEKPYPEFPLFPHRNGQWAKKARGRFVFFGPWRDPHGALERYLSQKDELHAGLVPRGAASAPAANGAAARGTAALATAPVDVPTLRDLANHFLTAKKRQMESGELSRRAFHDYFKTCEAVLGCLGKHRRLDDITTGDFGVLRSSLAETRGPVALANQIQRTRSLFKYGFEAGLLERPMRFGTEFRKPSKRSVRQARAARGQRLFEPKEIRKVLDAAGVQMKAMVLLGLNCGMGNTDVASLPIDALDLDAGVLEFPRTKTAIPRRATLWRETVDALRASLEARPEPKAEADSGLVFVTKYGHRWVRVKAPGPKAKESSQAVTVDGVYLEFSKVLRTCKIKSGGRGFYALRHTFRTVADEVGDRPAIDLVMGHQDGSDIATHYVERIGDERLRRVTEHVRTWTLEATGE